MLAVATLEVISVIKPKQEFKKYQSELLHFSNAGRRREIIVRGQSNVWRLPKY
jgi:hypothetical protein